MTAAGTCSVIGLDGTVQLSVDRPELEGRNLLVSEDSYERTAGKELIGIARDSQEGFCQVTHGPNQTPLE